MRKHIVFIEASTTGAGELAHVTAMRLGLRVTLLSRRPSMYVPSLLATADCVVTCDTNSIEEVHRVIAGLGSVDAVTTTADMYVPQAAYVAGILGLPGVSYAAARRGRNKALAREWLAAHYPVVNPRFAVVSTLSEARRAAKIVGFPLVVKPLAENDGFDVRLLTDLAAVEAYADRRLALQLNSAGQDTPAAFLVEEFIEGPEFSVETYQGVGQDPVVLGVTTKVLEGAGRGRFVEVGHAFPYRGPESIALMKSTLAILDAMELTCGVFHTECRITDKRVFLMEVNPRLAGGKIGSHLVPLAVGIDAVELVVRIALGDRVTGSVPSRSHGGAAIRFLWSTRNGVFHGLTNLEAIRKLPGVVHVAALAAPGARVRPPESNADTLAEIVTTGRSQEEAYALAEEAAAMAEVDIREELGSLGS